ncbi:WD40 repeat-like protein [Trichodelitschia bisporula]|uniref:WD40 repeat-like protein n=1 Tax=Trichodelitschia bisporula TaxID=703511 RepID=A0A6G1I9B4_9PEZI|nr:WD40 repeat-like protein [Trichodelitschia bisporula]
MGDSVVGVADGRGGLLAPGTSAPLYVAGFAERVDRGAEAEVYERRVALACGVDVAARVLGREMAAPGREWRDGEWTGPRKAIKKPRPVPIIPFRYVSFLDAPSLRDDYYCTLLAYSPTANVLAVGLGTHVYLWSETHGADTPSSLNTPSTAHVTSLAFSSPAGGQAILAIGRADGHLLLWSPLDTEPRFDSVHPSPISCVSFRPTTHRAPSARDPELTIESEVLLVGDEAGHIYIYDLEWPSPAQRDLFAWPGALTLRARVLAHAQQICGLAWAADGSAFASGGNDNVAHAFSTAAVLRAAAAAGGAPPRAPSPERQVLALEAGAYMLPASTAGHSWELRAAIKALAWCPWQDGLLAIGGGSNDRRIHFVHAGSGARLALIDCAAQVTGLVWSRTRREVCATFGFAQPEHKVRIAVFAWPSCSVVVRIPWGDEHRALCAVAYPRGPGGGGERGEGGVWCAGTREEGVLVVGTSDASIKFHEVWAEERGGLGRRGGLLGGSDILEGLHGIEKEGDVVR